MELANTPNWVTNPARHLLPGGGRNELIVSDYNAVEARGTAWLTDAKDLLGVFLRGEDPYLYQACINYKMPQGSFTKHNLVERQQGKKTILACLGADTLVLTRRGFHPITEVRSDDQLWDGVEWVQHEGLLNRGWKQTVSVAGVRMTPDHEIWNGSRWLRAAILARDDRALSQALAHAGANLPPSAMSWVLAVGSLASQSNAPAEALLPLSIFPTSGEELAPAATPAQRKPADSTRRIGVDTPTSSTTTPTDGASSTESAPAFNVATTPTKDITPIMVVEASSSISLGAPTNESSFVTSLPSQDGTPPPSNSTEKTTTKDTNPTTFNSAPALRTWQTDEALDPFSDGSLGWKPVFDIAHAGPRNRYMILTDAGPILSHNCGYQMGWMNFQYQCSVETPPILLTEAEAQDIVKAYRTGNPEIPAGWKDLEKGALRAVLNPGVPVDCCGGRIRWFRQGTWLYMRLPSGRLLSYADPHVAKRTMPWVNLDTGEPALKTCVGFMGVNSKTHRWTRQWGYGGLWMENAVQAICRDLLLLALLRLEAAGYAVVLSVHDEAVSEVPYGFGSVEEYNAIMEEPVPWAPGFPLKSEGWRGPCYKKGM